MSVVIEFQPKSLTTKQYDEIVRRMEIMDGENPRGRTYHVCYKTGNTLKLFNVWDSSKDFDRFSQKLNPILKELKIDLGRPEIHDIHKIMDEKHAHVY